ncbi:hypothetical protein FA10DRAFT_303634 [Acaromyces ingoldii]|uniref:Uncharacterized protein n=1 Tax=Acaromyces ingoldii TaxID=215250 RepID=A0A316YKX6_9BASI|nr:hypothetical protein FA10DRAFT_303634 [Acaromyces ingoldii]PWN88703.1 hypothetical protein FA10DRAFT_303634 [Acaromyces ingoldii]
MASSSGGSSSSSTLLRTASYRTLLRYAPHAVSHNRAASSNLRRAIRNNIESAPDAALPRFVTDCLALFLASCKRDDADGDVGSRQRNGLARRLCTNIASLQYHHYSYDVVMSRPGGRSRMGGTHTLALRRRRGNPAPSTTGVPLEEVLPSLTVPAKPRRGPHPGPPDARLLRPQRWDGQVEARRNGLLQVQLLEADLQRIEAQLARVQQQSQHQRDALVKEQTQLAKQKRVAEKQLDKHDAHLAIAARSRTLLSDALQAARGGQGLPLMPGR